LKISPIDIKKQEFKKVMRGYDAVEVETFLELVADEYEMIQKVNTDLRNKVKSLETELGKYVGMEKNLKSTLLEAQESSSIEKEKIKKESDYLIKEAEIKAMNIIEEAQKTSSDLKEEIAVLKSQRNSIASRLKYLLRSQIELVKILEADDIPLDKIVRRRVKGSKPEHKKMIEQKKEVEKAISKDEKPTVKNDPAADKSEAVPEIKLPVSETREPVKEPEKQEVKEEKSEEEDKKIVDGFNIIDKMILEKEQSEINFDKESKDED